MNAEMKIDFTIKIIWLFLTVMLQQYCNTITI